MDKELNAALETLTDMPWENVTLHDREYSFLSSDTPTPGQYARLKHLSDTAHDLGHQLHLSFPGDRRGGQVHSLLSLDCSTGAEWLCALAAQEPERRARGDEAARHLTHLTSTPWVWDDLRLMTATTLTPGETEPAAVALKRLETAGILKWHKEKADGTRQYLAADGIDYDRLRVLASSHPCGIVEANNATIERVLPLLPQNTRTK